MGWAAPYIEKLKAGETVSFRPRGNSMQPRIESGALCTVRPLKPDEDVGKHSIVLCRVAGSEYLHLVSAVQGKRYQISNNHNHVNGWVGRDSIFGLLVSVER